MQFEIKPRCFMEHPTIYTLYKHHAAVRSQYPIEWGHWCHVVLLKEDISSSLISCYWSLWSRSPVPWVIMMEVSDDGLEMWLQQLWCSLQHHRLMSCFVSYDVASLNTLIFLICQCFAIRILSNIFSIYHKSANIWNHRTLHCSNAPYLITFNYSQVIQIY